MTDHKAEAEKLTAMKYAVGAPIGAVRHNDALAQVHATLYLAEQQRTANVIAAIGRWGCTESSWPAEVREGLGL